jgi:hypothetical protein
VPRPNRHLFDREADLLLRTRARLRGVVRVLLRVVGLVREARPRVVDQMRRSNLRKTGDPIQAQVSRRVFRVRGLPRGTGAGAVVVSVGLHVVIGAFLIVHYLQPSSPPPPKPEMFISIRLPVTKPPDPKPKAPEPPPPPTPEPKPKTKTKKTPPDPKPVKKTPDVAKKVAPPGPKTKTREKPKVTRRGPKSKTRIRPFRDPPPLGVGSSPPRAAGGAGNALMGALSSRGEEGKIRALAAYGGNGRTENAVDLGLRWLAEHQDSDGGWDSYGFQRHCRHYTACPGPGLKEFDIGVSSLAVLAFLGAGHTPRSEGAYRRHVAKGLEYLIDHQDGAGAFGVEGDKYLYNHALATLALAEAVSMTGEESYRESLNAALRYTLAAQQPGGAWDYSSEKTGRHDLSITGWQIMALRGAEQAGAPISLHTKQAVRHYINRALTTSGYGIYANLDPEAGRRGVNMTAVGLLGHLYTGGMPADQRTRAAVRRLLPNHPPDTGKLRRWNLNFQSYYYWYAATLALFHLGGESWEAWNTLLQRTLLPLQTQQVHIRGSWNPEPNWIGLSGGRVYATAINVLTLEVYYRYRPLFASRRS